MKFETIQYHNLPSDEKGGMLRMSAEKGGCGLKECNCSPGHWLSVLLPTNKRGITKGILVHFDDLAELEYFMLHRELDQPSEHQSAIPS